MFHKRFMSTQERKSGDEDEYFKYYRQYRPGFLPASRSLASSEEISDNFSSSNSSSVGSFRNTLQNLLPKKKKRRHFFNRSRSEETGIYNSSRLVVQRKNINDEPPFRILPDVYENPMSCSNNDALSRDSGHSSGGSPDFRVFAKRKPIGVKAQLRVGDLYKAYCMSEPRELETDEVNMQCHLDSWELPPSIKETIIQRETQRRLTAKDPNIKKQRGIREFLADIFLIFVSILIFCLFGLLSLYIHRGILCYNNLHHAFNISSLKKELEQNLFGQSWALKEILRSVSELSRGGVSVLLLTGSTGTGKTLVTNIIHRGFPSPINVHSFFASLHFVSPNSSYLNVLDDLTISIPLSCGYSLVIFDDVDFAEADNLNYIGSFIASLNAYPASRRLSNGTLVILATTTGGSLINEHMLKSARSGNDLEDVDISDLRTKLQKLPNLPLLEYLQNRGLSVTLIPFLPLTRQHVRKCISNAFAKASLHYSVEDVNTIVEQITFFPADFPIFSSSGCKRVTSKVDLLHDIHNDEF